MIKKIIIRTTGQWKKDRKKRKEEKKLKHCWTQHKKERKKRKIFGKIHNA